MPRPSSQPVSPQASPEEIAELQYEASKLIATTEVLTALCAVVLILRMGSRIVMGRRATRTAKWGPWFWYDDVAALLSFPFLIAFLALHIYTMSHATSTEGIQRQATDRSYVWHLEYESYVTDQMYRTSLSLIKTSVLLFYVRVFSISARTWWRMCAWLLMSFTWAWFLAFSALALFRCNPVRRAWEIPGTKGKCLQVNPIYLGARITDMIIDFGILILPLPMLWGLQMKLVKKMGLIAVFCLGYASMAMSLLRLIFVVRVSASKRSQPEYFLVHGAVYWILEPSIAFIGICVPAMFALVRAGVGRVRSSIKQYSHGTRNSSRALNHERVDALELPTRCLKNNDEEFSSSEEALSSDATSPSSQPWVGGDFYAPADPPAYREHRA